MNKKRLAVIVLLIIMVLLPFWLNQRKKEGNINSRILVTTSIYPWYEAARMIGGGAAQIEKVTPDGIEAHDYEPTINDLQKIKNASVFIYNGRGLDPWAEKAVKENSGKKIIVATAFDTNAETKEIKDDPHVWLNFKTMIRVGESIKTALIEVDPDNREVYEKNYLNYRELLLKTEREYETGLANCNRKEIISSHNAFGQLSANYDIRTDYISEKYSEGEPSVKKMTEIIKKAKDKKLKYIFYESLGNRKPIERIAAEANLKLLELNPLEGLTEEQKETGENYFSLVLENLNNLKVGLECQ